MGTNYYLRTETCTNCNRSYDGLHIGKSSHGWQFHFRGYLDQSIVCYEDWLNEFNDKRKRIYNEYGESYTIEKFKEVVESKKEGLNHYNVTNNIPMTEKEKEYCKDKFNPYKSEYKCWKDNNGFTFTDNVFC